MKYPLYRFLRPIIKFMMHFLFRMEVVNKDYLPKEGSYILAGNHKSNFDCVLLIATTNRTIRFLAKKELLDSKFSFIFKKMGIIPVDRSKRNNDALNASIDVLNTGGVIGIFPEGTFNNTEYIIRSFKIGTVKMASETNSLIVPFAIIGNYKLFKKTKIVIGKPYKIISKDLKGENITLMNKVVELLKDEYN